MDEVSVDDGDDASACSVRTNGFMMSAACSSPAWSDL